MTRLRVTSGPLGGETIEVVGELVIGRHEADLTIEDPEISRRHAVVRVAAGGLEIEDLGSSNGTFVDGVRINGPAELGGGSRITLGGSELEVVGAPRPAQPTAPPIGAFRPPVRRRRRGLASRSWVPTVLSFGTVIVVAVALVIYFAAR